MILCALVYLIAQAYALAYLSIIDLLFPALGLFACWRFKTTELKASANTIRSSHLMLVVRAKRGSTRVLVAAAAHPTTPAHTTQYIAWCVLWIVLGVILLLFRTGVIVAGSSNTLAQQFFGNASASYTTPLIILTAVQLGTMVT